MMIDEVMVVVVFGWCVIGLLVVRAELEEVRQRREQEEQELQQQFLGRPDSDDDWQQPEQLDLDDLYDQQQCEE